MTFPPSSYTERGGVGTVKAHARVAALVDARNDDRPDPASPAATAGSFAPEQPEALSQPLAA